MNRPWMPFYIADYLADTGHLSTIEHGAYLLLIFHYWQNGSLPTDDKSLANICKMPMRSWKQSKNILQSLIGYGWRSQRLESAIADVECRYAEKAFRNKKNDKKRPSPDEWLDLRMQVFTRDAFTCVYCEKIGGNLECDHVVPIARGGMNEVGNLATSCKACNRAKGTQLLSEWKQ